MKAATSASDQRDFMELFPFAFGEDGQKAIGAGGASAAFRDEASDEARRRDIEGGIGAGASGCGDFDRGEPAVRQSPRHLQKLVGGTFLDRNVATVRERPVNRRGRKR